MRKTFWIVFVLFLPIFQSCAAEPFVMEEMIDRKISGLTIGASKEEIIPKFGQPQYAATIPRGPDTVEVWEFELGNYTHYEAKILVFMNGKLIATPNDNLALLKLLKALRVLEDMSLWIPKKNFEKNGASA